MYYRWSGHAFEPSSRNDFVATLPNTFQSCVFVHGNRKSADDAQEQGFDVYRRLNCPGLRFIIWSWPSERITGLVRDARAKADRADVESCYLGSFLADYTPDANVTVIAHSFGARTATGSLHLLAGGSVCGRQLPAASERVHPRLALFAAALPRQWLLPHGAHGLALVQAQDVVSFFNRRDPLLKHFDLVFKPGRPQALGLEGINAAQCGPQGAMLSQYDVSQSIGHTHALSKYLETASIISTVRSHSLAFASAPTSIHSVTSITTDAPVVNSATTAGANTP